MVAALNGLAVLFLSFVLAGCVTSREDDYVASVIADAMGTQYAVDGSATGDSRGDSRPEISSAQPVFVSVTPGGTVSAVPVTGVSESPAAPSVAKSPAASVVPSSVVPATSAVQTPMTPDAVITGGASPGSGPKEPDVAVPMAESRVQGSVAPVGTEPVATPVQDTNTAPASGAEMLKPSEPTIQPDTIVWVSVTEDPSLNGRYVVNGSSAIDFGYVGLVFLQDMNVQQAEAVIKNVLEGRYLNHATVSVKIAKASYDSVGVLGNVEAPGEVKIGPGSTITLSDALRRAGGLRGNRESNRIKIIRGGLRSPFGPTAEGDVYSLTTSSGDLKIPLIYLRNNDLAYAYASESPHLGSSPTKTAGTGKRVILLGEVPRRGVVEFAENEPCTLMYLLFKIGGLPRFAKADKIQIIRREKDGHERSFTANGAALMEGGNPKDDVVLESGDRIIVPARKIAFF